MRTCTQCRSQATDTELICPSCGTDLNELSETAVALARLKANPRIGSIRVMPHGDCCPACRAAEGEFHKDKVPNLPVPGCSHPLGCRCFYGPDLVELYP